MENEIPHGTHKRAWRARRLARKVSGNPRNTAVSDQIMRLLRLRLFDFPRLVRFPAAI
jgi:hypothetical protein